MLVLALNVVGLLLQALGVFTTWRGISETYLAHGDGKSLWQFVWQPVLAQLRWLAHHALGQLARLIPALRQSATVHAASGTARGSFTITGTATGTVGWPGLPADIPMARAVELLDEQVANLYRNLNLMGEHLGGKAANAEARLDVLEAGVDEVGTGLEATKRELAVEGLRTEAVGLLWLSAGVLVQVVALLLGASG